MSLQNGDQTGNATDDQRRTKQTGKAAEYLRMIGVPDLPPRTSPFDPGYDPVTVESHIEQSGHLMSVLKISMACWQIADESATRRKVQMPPDVTVFRPAPGAGRSRLPRRSVRFLSFSTLRRHRRESDRGRRRFHRLVAGSEDHRPACYRTRSRCPVRSRKEARRDVHRRTSSRTSSSRGSGGWTSVPSRSSSKAGRVRRTSGCSTARGT